MIKKDGVAWGAFINLRGLYHDKPMKLVRKKNYCGDWKWVTSSYFDLQFPKLGKHYEEGLIYFSSKNKGEVQAWIDGAKAMAKLIRGIVKEGYNE